jgi:hypothetical protein
MVIYIFMNFGQKELNGVISVSDEEFEEEPEEGYEEEYEEEYEEGWEEEFEEA